MVKSPSRPPDPSNVPAEPVGEIRCPDCMGTGFSDADRYANLYLNFWDHQQWFEALFASMTFKDYMGF